MIKARLDRIEERINQSKVKESDRAEMLELIAELRTEISRLSATHREQAESIADFAEVSTREATREDKSPALFNISLAGLNSSVQEFEVTHPRLVGIVNRFCLMLYNMGV